MSNIKQTKSYKRLKQFHTDMSSATSDEDILLAGHDLLEAWKGYQSQKNADAGKRAIKQILKELG
jgi:endo-1,4-beta-D-glucanase Y